MIPERMIYMKILILSVTAGQGHNSTAKALSERLMGLGAEVRVLDTMRYINKLLGKTVDKGYLFISSRAKLAYKGAYRLAEMRKKTIDELNPTRITAKMLSQKLKKYIDSFDPDLIICTHVYAGIFVDVIKSEQKLRAKSIAILTDFAFHPYWEEGDDLDYVVVPNESLYLKAREKGFHDGQILPFGIPISPKFENQVDKREAKLRLGLDPDRNVILLMGGSMGYGNIVKTVDRLDSIMSDFQIISVCGSNKTSKAKIDSRTYSKTVLNFGFTSNVDELMDAADCIITKPGGLTSSEALAKGLPMIIINPIPGQEDRNTEFLVNNGCAMAVTPTYTLEEIVFTLFNVPGRLEAMKKCISIYAHPDSTRRICDFAIKLAKKAIE